MGHFLGNGGANVITAYTVINVAPLLFGWILPKVARIPHLLSERLMGELTTAGKDNRARESIYASRDMVPFRRVAQVLLPTTWIRTTPFLADTCSVACSASRTPRR